VSLSDFTDARALLVVFLCNHCPYVKNMENALGDFASDYADRGLATVGISANDIASHSDDSPAHMVEQAARAGFDFPYLYDESQQAALRFGAACTPDFFLFDADHRLAYRGQMDGARPGNGVNATAEDLRTAADLVLAGQSVPEPHIPSVGCSIKWKPGNAPSGFLI
jgi:peroxiredoxin